MGTKQEQVAVRNEQIRKLAKKGLSTLRSYLDPGSAINLRKAELSSQREKLIAVRKQLESDCESKIKRRTTALLETASFSMLRDWREHSNTWAAQRNGFWAKSFEATFWGFGRPTPEALEAKKWLDDYEAKQRIAQQQRIAYEKQAKLIEEEERGVLKSKLDALPALPRLVKIPEEALVREAICIREKQEDLRVAAAKNVEKQRDIASKVIRTLPRNHDCPYCGGDLGASPHADHIYPVSKGGRSTVRNLVYVCVDCNSKKSDLTLRIFVRNYDYDFEAIEKRLEELGKDF